MKQRLTMFMISLFLFAGSALAQTKVSGTVFSQEDGQPIIGAAVKVEGTSTGMLTDVNGRFSLTVPQGKSQITVSYLGFESKTMTAKNGMRVFLKSDAQSLDEVMVVAFGTQKKQAFTGSASVVGAEKLDQHVTTNVANALVGSVSGLQMRGGSGAPGSDDGKINIRGIASLYASTDPLIIVDGAPYGASLSNLAQDDIESISVLKDAASAALYGARGAAGVIIITTKKGSKSEPKINVNMRWGANSRAIQDYETINDPGTYYESVYQNYYNYATANGLEGSQATTWANRQLLNGLKYQVYTIPDGETLIGENGKLNPNAKLGYKQVGTDGNTYYYQPDSWIDEAYHTAFRQEYDVNFSGGNERGDFYLSAGYLDEDGIIDNSGFRRFNTRLKANYDIKKWLKVGANVGYVSSKTTSNPNLDNSQLGSTNLNYYATMIAPIYPIYVRVLDADGNPTIHTDQYGNPHYDYGRPNLDYPVGRAFLQTGNPLGSNHYNKVYRTGMQLQTSGYAEIKFTDWLKFNHTSTVNWNHTNFSDYETSLYGPKVTVNGQIDKNQDDYVHQNHLQTLTFNKDFNEHNLGITLGHEWYRMKRRYLSAAAQGLFSPEIQEISAAANNQYTSSSSSTAYNVEGWFGRALYNYQEKYFADFSLRRDASSRFHKDHRWGTFWSVGGAWLISKEKFMEGASGWLDELKLKASIGQKGNDGLNNNWYFADRYTLSRASKTNMSPSFSGIGNKDVTWETTTAFNVGLEFSLLKRRINGSIDFYNNKITDLLAWLSIPESNGVRGYWGNLGDIRNTGIEFQISADVIRTKDITWNIWANIAHNKTKILKLPESKIKQNGGFAETNNNIQMWYAEGGELYQPFLYSYAGVDPETGEALYWYDADLSPAGGNVAANNTAKAATNRSGKTNKIGEASRYAGKSLLPAATGGFGTTLYVYGFDVSVNFDYQLGGKVWDYHYKALMGNLYNNGDAGSALHVDALNAWTPTNTNTDVPRMQYGDAYTNYSSDRWLTSARYLNFQSFSVGYTLPKSVVSKLRLNKLRVYATGENLTFWSARKGLDPRYSYEGNEMLNTYSPTRTIMGGIQLTF